ncbi:pentatricopeptide repeat-containing protein [Striga asiatica]|uniref:Pentatricopeptide repeat-containing protein n=1 Tax=Striga asiatica TaxID=4170 RepID=A0A5A7QDU9_STRAF|nr:pentatricopeptide repeat-containing protein [Striga asiatica]
MSRRRPIDYGLLIQRCTDRRLHRQAKQLHAHLILTSAAGDNYLASKLMAFYSRTHNLRDARHVFDQIPHKNIFTCNAILIAHTVNHRHAEALELFTAFVSRDSRDLESVRPDGYTFSCVLKAAAEVAAGGPLLARLIHCCVIKHGLDWDVFVNNGLLTYYSRCADFMSAQAVFDEMPQRDLVSWNSMISGYSQAGFYEECKDLYRTILRSNGPKPDNVTAVSALQACANSSDLLLGMDIHKYVTDNKIKMDLTLCNSIISVYSKCGSLDYARELYEEMGEKDEITYATIVTGYMAHGLVDEAMQLFEDMTNPGLSTWNALISGKIQNSRYKNVLDLVRRMQISGLRPNSVTLSSVLPAIPQISNLKAGKEIHAYAIKSNSDKNIYVTTAIIDTYGKLGFLDGAQRVFDLARDRSVIVWTAIISAYAHNGKACNVLGFFHEMLRNGTKPDPVTFTTVLSACAHAGLVQEAQEIFYILPKYGIQPLANHYACVVDCLCRAGSLREAVEFVKKMPIEPTAQVWGALLGGAKEFGNVELAEFACGYLFELEPENPSNYVVLANLYSGAGRWEEAEKVRGRMMGIGYRKVAGSSRV